jgi:hypothetical protein
MLRTYEVVLDDLNGKKRPVDGVQALIDQAQKFGG